MTILRSLAWLTLYCAAAFSFLVETGRLGAPRAPDLTRLPERLAGLEILEEIPVDTGAFGAQPPERHAYRRVRDARGQEGCLFIAWYERAQRWSGRPHDVEKCFTALGWQEREARRLEEEHRPWSRRFERARDGGTEAIRVVHWLERPGPDLDRLSGRELLARLRSTRGFRQDVASVYFEFPAEAAPPDAEFVGAVRELSRVLEELW